MVLLHLQVGLTLNVIQKWVSQKSDPPPHRLLPPLKAEYLEPRLLPLFKAEHLEQPWTSQPAPSLNQGKALGSYMVVGIIQFTWIPPH